MAASSTPDPGPHLPADTGDHPILVNVTRGSMVESRHRVHCAVVDADGGILRRWGNPDLRIYPRSALKPLQAVALLETGAADAAGLDDREIALACASHNGEKAHFDRVCAWLDRLGLAPGDLECGPQWPRLDADHADMIRAHETPIDAHNNCSGKHAGMLTLARYLGVETRGYTNKAHPVQNLIMATIAEMADLSAAGFAYGTDGCSAPNPAMALRNLGLACARLGRPDGLNPARRQAAARIVQAMTTQPYYVAGSNRLCTTLMQAAGGKIAAKTGAEGVYIAILPDLGAAITLKAEDGAGRAAQAALGAVLDALGVLTDDARAAIRPFTNPTLRNWRNIAVGEVTIAALN